MRKHKDKPKEVAAKSPELALSYWLVDVYGSVEDACKAVERQALELQESNACDFKEAVSLSLQHRFVEAIEKLKSCVGRIDDYVGGCPEEA